MSRSRPFWSRTGTTSTTPAVIRLPNGAREVKLWVDALSYAQLGTSYTAPAVTSTNGVTTISSEGTPTADTFVMRVYPADTDVFTTSALTFDESAADVKTALIAASTVFVTGDITAAGGALPTAITLTWTGAYAGVVPEIDIVSSVTGGTNSRIVARTTTAPDGNGGYGYVEANTQESWEADITGNAKDRYLYIATVVAAAGNYRVSTYR